MNKVSNAIGQGFAVLLIAGLGCAANGDTPGDVVAIGPLELAEATSVTVLGRSYRVADTSGLTAGEKVAVHGTLQPDGSVTEAWAESLGAYSAGSDPVFEAGVVTGISETFGRLSIGDSNIDYTAALSEEGATVPAVGQMVAIAGTQPAIGGIILGTTTNAGDPDVQIALTGTGARAGMAIAGITGTNRSTAGITGTNRSTAGITGTNGSTAGITGTNRSTAGITGTNRSTAGITGTNRSTAGITGTNRASAGITGTNRSTAGITGTNRASAGITGTNRSTAGITGTNRSTAGITGTNRSTAGITGTNRSAAGITGTNRSTAGITGTNKFTAGITGTNAYDR
jgi:hypothetical protein